MRKVNNKTALIGLFILIFLPIGLFILFRFSTEDFYEPTPEVPVEFSKVVITEVPTEPNEEREPAMLDWLVPYYEENPNVVGWLRLPGTAIDFPIYQSGVEYTGRSHEPYWDFYLTSNRDGQRGDGELYVWPDHQNDDISIDDAELFFVFAHNFRYFHNGEIYLGQDGEIRQFSELPSFDEDEDFWYENREILFSTLYEEDILYEVAWVFELDSIERSDGHTNVHFVDPDRREVSSTLFRFMQQRRFTDEDQFNDFLEQMDHYAIRATQDVAYGDRLIFLLTCQTRPYTSSRRLVVVGRHRD